MGKKIEYRYKWLCGAVVEKFTHEGSCGFKSCRPCSAQKMPQLATWRSGCVAGWWGPLRIKYFLFPILKIIGKLFAVCLINGTRQRISLSTPVCHVQHMAEPLPCTKGPLLCAFGTRQTSLFTECFFYCTQHTQGLCRVLEKKHSAKQNSKHILN